MSWLGIIGFYVVILVASFCIGWSVAKMQATHRRSRKAQGWVNTWHGNELHTSPRHDLIEHTFDDCACSPKTVPVETDDGGIHWQVIHSALDGRK